MTSSTVIESLRRQIASCEAQLQDLRQQLVAAERSYAQHEDTGNVTLPVDANAQNQSIHDTNKILQNAPQSNVTPAPAELNEKISSPRRRWPLLNSEYQRYGRQLIMPEIGLQGQLQLKNASVLIVGVGGLGCPAAAYLVGAGIGTVGLVDGDTVEESNLHRQILHSTTRVGMTKVESAVVALNALNPNIKLVPHITCLTPETALSIFQPYDLVLDCTDTPASRYLISDTCVLLGKPLVSASALRTDGQLMVLNNPPRPAGDTRGGPCYRCVFPKPPPPESVVSCGDGGILGPVVGLMGVLQALEAIKVLTSGVRTPPTSPSEPPTLLLFSAYANPMFRSIRLRARKPKCAACSATASVTPQALTSGSLDYVQFCGSVAPVDTLAPENRVSAEDYAKLTLDARSTNTDTDMDGNDVTSSISSNCRNSSATTTSTHILIDVREKVQFDLCNLDGSINVPFSAVSSTHARTSDTDTDKLAEEQKWVSELRSQPDTPIYVVCRLGNDSQITVKKLQELGLDNNGERWIGDIRGGLRAWRQNVDHEFPDY